MPAVIPGVDFHGAAGILPTFLDRLLPRVARIRLGDPLDPATQMGALISDLHRKRVHGYVERGRADGAKLLCGGKIPAGLNPGGYFYEPTVFSECDDRMAIVREEIFGPVLSLLTFRDEQEVIERANATDFGLAAGIFTKDLQRAHRVVAQLQAGTCWINNYNIIPIELPFGGMKHSGLGRENSMAAIQHYTQLKSVYVEMGTVQSPF